MTSLPSGLASISSRLDDSPQVRGAVAFGRTVRLPRVSVGTITFASGRSFEVYETIEVYGALTEGALLRAVAEGKATIASEPDLTSAIDRHAALVIGSAYRAQDRR